MLVRLSTAIAATCLLSGAALAQGAAKPTDPQIAHIAYTAGQLDIEAAKQALSKTTNTDVRAFAEGMVGDHTAVNKQALDPSASNPELGSMSHCSGDFCS
jgi:putative membrane protein